MTFCDQIFNYYISDSELFFPLLLLIITVKTRAPNKVVLFVYHLQMPTQQGGQAGAYKACAQRAVPAQR